MARISGKSLTPGFLRHSTEGAGAVDVRDNGYDRNRKCENGRFKRSSAFGKPLDSPIVR
jgi:hypothetical protein